MTVVVTPATQTVTVTPAGTVEVERTTVSPSVTVDLAGDSVTVVEAVESVSVAEAQAVEVSGSTVGASVTVASPGPQGPTGPTGPTGASSPFGSVFDVTAEGAVGDGTTDDVAAIQAVCDAADAAGGGVVFFPPGTYKCSTSIDLSQSHNVTLAGSQGLGGPLPGLPKSRLLFTGTGSGRFLDCRSSTALNIRDLGINYNSTSFTGSLIDFSHSSASDSSLMLIERCNIGGLHPSVYTAEVLISFEVAILGTVRDCHLSYGGIGIRGRVDRGGGNVGYSNAFTVQGNLFDNLTVSAIMNVGQGWNIVGNWIEGTNNAGFGGMPHFIYDDLDSDSIIYGLTVTGNWAGDDISGYSGTHWIEFPETAVYGMSVTGNFIDSVEAAIKFGHGAVGVHIAGNWLRAVDLGSSASGVCNGVSILGNGFAATGGNEVLNQSGHKQVSIFGNHSDGYNNGFDLYRIAGHIESATIYDAAPTIAAGAAAGTGPTVTVSGTDLAGTVNVTTGTSTTTGTLATVTFARPYGSAPKVILEPSSSAAGANVLARYVSSTTTTFVISAGVAPTASVAHSWHYHVIA